MIWLIATAALAAAPAPADPCAGQAGCVQATAAQLFAAADEAAAKGDLAGAATILEALTQDPNLPLRAEARFRLAAVHEKQRDLPGAIASLRALLAEQPDAQRARLELARLLALSGDDRAARRELGTAEAAGLPQDVAGTVKRFSAALNSRKRRGLSLELGAGPDSNINRSTTAQYVDTVIAPFELDPDARRQSGLVLSVGGQAFSRDAILDGTLLTRAGLYGAFSSKRRFNDVQLALSTGPELATGLGRLRPALTYERRWYGGDAYSRGYGVALNLVTLRGPSQQVELDASAARQSIRNNAFLDGYRYSLSAAYDRIVSPDTTARLAVRGSALDAEVRPESIRQGNVEGVLAHNFGLATLFVQGGYTKTRGRAPLALFGKTRDDDRFDLGGGMIAHRLRYAGFAPLVRVTYTDSRSNLELYDYRRTKVELGLSRDF